MAVERKQREAATDPAVVFKVVAVKYARIRTVRLSTRAGSRSSTAKPMRGATVEDPSRNGCRPNRAAGLEAADRSAPGFTAIRDRRNLRGSL
jgi:hypothetical protein